MAEQPSMTSGSSVPTSNQSIPTTVPNSNTMDWSNGTRNNTTVSQVLISASPSSSINTTAMSSTSAVSSNNSQPGMVNSSPANTSTVTLVSTPTIKPNQPQQIIQQQQHTITTQSVQQIPQSSSTISSHQSSQPSSASTPQQGYTAAASGSNAGTLSGAVAGVPSTLGSSHVAQGGSPARAHLRTNTAADASKGLEKQRLAELIREVDPQTQVDEDVEESLIKIADDFIDNLISSASKIASHRKSRIVEPKDVQMMLSHKHNMWIPGYGGGSDEYKPYKRPAATEAHKQRCALIKKTIKKY